MKRVDSLLNIFTRKNVSIFILSLVIVFNIYTGILGVDFGFHWDEDKTIGSIQNSVQTGLLLPEWYNYPSMCFDLGLVMLSTQLGSFIIGKKFKINMEDLSVLQNHLVKKVQTKDFKINLRILFIILSSLTIIWVYIAVINMRGNLIEALLASILTALSWEVSYHSRWIATDAILMQFGFLTMACLLYALKHHENKIWIYVSSVAVGLACSTKYPGGLLLVPLFMTVCSVHKMNENTCRIFSDFFKVFVVFIITFLVITPGMLVEPLRFIHDVIFEIRHYSSAGHLGYTLTPGINYLIKLFNYLCFVVFSKYYSIAIAFFIMALIGIGVLIQNTQKGYIIFMSFPFLYILYFSSQCVMIVRNFLIIIPFFAVFASIGIVFLFRKIRFRLGRILFTLFIAGLLTINTIWIVKAARSISLKDRTNYISHLIDYIDQHNDTLFYLTPSIASAVLSEDGKKRHNISMKISDAIQIAVFYSSEVKDPNKWEANHWDYTIRSFGPYEVNFNYYPTWEGENRILLMKPQVFNRLKIIND